MTAILPTGVISIKGLWLYLTLLLYRDIKLENILFMDELSDTNVKLIDFGFAAVVTESGLAGYVGTPFYIAPEVYAHKNGSVVAASYGENCHVSVTCDL